ncbi:serine hydrolase [Alteromonas sp. ASW11-19]|uniref:Serine hydrolase n=1 Tax=Alteromonas salexigens TaxID=2982530 RepID=A0ABT2VRA8_9ALTE|nr:serine hydrolase [Alteromonas salexigens]MCU7555594.1 serine hydrolase [Alteromonas salexigens]
MAVGTAAGGITGRAAVLAGENELNGFGMCFAFDAFSRQAICARLTKKNAWLVALLTCVFLSPALAVADSESSNFEQRLAGVVDKSLAAFNTPGMAVGILHQDKIIYLAGHGYRDLEHKLPVTPDTYFLLASASKAFTASAMAVASNRGDLHWQDKVTAYLPSFALASEHATENFTLTDLLTHRSGLGSGAGDIMLWPAPSKFSRREIIHNLRFLTPQSAFRQRYAYNNLMYITAAAVVDAAGEQSWDQLVQEEIFNPLKMQCFVGRLPDTHNDNVAQSYGFTERRGTYPIPRNAINTDAPVWTPAGGIVCNARDMLNWLAMWLREGKAADGTQVLTTDTVKHMTTPVTPLPVSGTDKAWFDTRHAGYALGWRVADQFGEQVISHTGTVSGYQAFVAFVPNHQLGVVLLNNGSDYGSRGAVMQTILQHFLAPEQAPRDWIAAYQEFQRNWQQRTSERNTPPQGSGTVTLPLGAYAGHYADTWFGKVSVIKDEDGLYLHSHKMPSLTGRLKPFNEHSFKVLWDNPDVMEPVLVTFEQSSDDQISQFTLAPFTVRLQRNHPFRDMTFRRTP